MESYEDRRDANRMNYWPDFYFKFTALVIFASTLKIKAEQLAVKFISYNGRPIRLKTCLRANVAFLSAKCHINDDDIYKNLLMSGNVGNF